MRVLYFICIISCFATILSSCSYKQNQLLFQNTSQAVADTLNSQGSVTPGSYRIHPLDQLQIRNLQSAKFLAEMAVPTGSANNSQTVNQGQIYQVEEDGTIALPEIGHIKVVDLTRIQATKVIEDLYRKNVLVNPVFEIKVINLKVTLLGEAKSPGNFPLLKDNTTLVELLGQAGGLTINANERNVKIIRGDKIKTVTEIDLSKLSAISDPRAILQNGDIIYVAQNKRAVRNDNLQNFTIVAQPALLLINTALLIFNLTRL